MSERMASTYGVAIRLRRGRVLVAERTGGLATMEDAIAVQETIEGMAQRFGARKLVLDNRRTDPSSAAAVTVMRKWLRAADFDAVALVLESELLRVSVNMDSVGTGRRIRAFGTVDDAVEWADEEDGAPRSVRSPSPEDSQNGEAATARRSAFPSARRSHVLDGYSEIPLPPGMPENGERSLPAHHARLAGGVVRKRARGQD